MLNYGAEVLGLTADHTFIERILKNLSLKMVFSETGLYPLFVNINVECVKGWSHILQMSPCRLSRMNKTRGHEYPLFAMRCASSTWLSWVHQGAGGERAFPEEFKETVLSYTDETGTTVEEAQTISPSTAPVNLPCPWHRT